MSVFSNFRHRTLLRDHKHAIEKEQAIKLIRSVVELGTLRRESDDENEILAVPVSERVMRSIIAVAEHLEDPFRLICIQTLAEISKRPAPFLPKSVSHKKCSDSGYWSCGPYWCHPFLVACVRRRANRNYPHFGSYLPPPCRLSENPCLHSSWHRFGGTTFGWQPGPFVWLMIRVDCILCHYWCLRQATGPCGENERLYESDTTDA